MTLFTHQTFLFFLFSLFFLLLFVLVRMATDDVPQQAFSSTKRGDTAGNERVYDDVDTIITTDFVSRFPFFWAIVLRTFTSTFGVDISINAA